MRSASRRRRGSGAWDSTSASPVRPHRRSSAEDLADDLVLRITEATGLSDRGVFARPGLYVLRKTRMPAVLLELGFITNRRDADLMAYSPGLFAAGIANGLMTYLRST